MTVCNFCSRRESCAIIFSLPFTCKECEEKHYTEVRDDYGITYIDASGKNLKIHNDTVINVVNDSNNICNMEINKEVIEVIDTNDFKDVRLASLYSQVEYLKNESQERNTHIRTLLSIIKDCKPLYEDVAQNTLNENISKGDMDNSEIIDLHTPKDGSENNDIQNSTTLEDISTMATSTDYESNESIDFNDLYLQYVRDTGVEGNKSFSLMQQLQEIRAVKNLEYNDIIVSRRDNNSINVSEENYNSSIVTSNNSEFTSACTKNTSWKNNEQFKWEKHLTGLSKIMGKMGYKGRGLGKAEDGIIENTKEIGRESKKKVNK